MAPVAIHARARHAVLSQPDSEYLPSSSERWRPGFLAQLPQHIAVPMLHQTKLTLRSAKQSHTFTCIWLVGAVVPLWVLAWLWRRMGKRHTRVQQAWGICTTTGDIPKRPENFRLLPFPSPVPKIFRSADPDQLSVDEMAALGPRVILDLRSPEERQREPKWIEGWMVYVFNRNDPPKESELLRSLGQDGTVVDDDASRPLGTLWRIDVLDADRVFQYMKDVWWPPPKRAQATMWEVLSGAELQRMRLQELNQRGLEGLYEAMLQTAGPELCFALQVISLAKDPVLLHCVKGKDRTGILSALILSIMGVDADTIVTDYALSDPVQSRQSDEKKAKAITAGDRLDKLLFARAPASVMVSTLQYIAKEWSSVEGYLDHIGFDEQERQRLRANFNHQPA